MSVAVTNRRYPEVHKALCALLGSRKAFKIIDHFETWLPKADRGLGALRRKDAGRWLVFVAGDDLAAILRIRDRRTDLRGAHQILDFMAN